MKRAKIDKVATVAKIAEQQSARELGAVQQDHQQKCAQLDQLVQFKQDYETTLGTVGGQGIEAKQLQDYRLFLSKLQLAIEQQVKEVQQTEENLEIVRTEWLSSSQRRSALDHLVDEQNRAELHARAKAQQKESDENTLARRIRGDNQ